MLQNKKIIMIDLGACDSWTDVSKILKQHGIKYYTYSFISKNGILKHGRSADNQPHWGERIYRQAGHLEGWDGRLRSSSGSDMRIIAEEYQKKYNEVLDRKDISIRVVDCTDASDPERETIVIEEYLISETMKHNGGCAPLGNKDTKTRKRSFRAKNTIAAARLFEGFDLENFS